MEIRKVKLLERIESDQDVLLEFLQGFIRCPSPNPPGDTRAAAAHIRKLLDHHGVAHRVIAPQRTMPNYRCDVRGRQTRPSPRPERPY